MRRRLMIVVWACALLCTLLIQTSLGDPIRALSIDSLVWLRDRFFDNGPTSSEYPIAVIAVDENTYQRPPFRGTPRVAWSNYLARVIEALLVADATVIGFDIVLSTSLDSHLPGIDKELLEVLRNGSLDDRVVLGEILHSEARIQPYHGYRAVVGFERNIRPLDVIVDSDGVIRRMPLSLYSNSADGGMEAMPSMALELANRIGEGGVDQNDEYFGRQLAGSSLLASDFARQDEGAIINLRRRNISIPTYSLADLYHCAEFDNSSYFAEHFSGKVVLVGSALDVEDQVLSSARFIVPDLEPRPVESCTASSSRDRFSYSNGPTMPGVYLHAAMVQNLIDDDVIETMTTLSHAILTLLAVGCLMMIGINFQPILSLPILGLMNVIVILGSTAAFAYNLLFFFLMPAAGSLVGYAAGLSLQILILERRRGRIRDAFNHLLPKNVVEQLIDRNEFPSAGGKLVTCTVLLTDLENYTGLAEQLKPDELVEVLNQVNQVLGDVIEHHSGIVSWHAGDSILALFGTPIECTDHAVQGVKAALDCRLAVDGLNNSHLLSQGIKLRIRIGVSTGEILVGYVGSDRQLTYSAIGDHVNIASRLEGLNKVYGTSVLVNETTCAQAEHEFEWHEVDKTIVKGRKACINVFEPRWK